MSEPLNARQGIETISEVSTIASTVSVSEPLNARQGIETFR